MWSGALELWIKEVPLSQFELFSGALDQVACGLSNILESYLSTLWGEFTWNLFYYKAGKIMRVSVIKLQPFCWVRTKTKCDLSMLLGKSQRVVRSEAYRMLDHHTMNQSRTLLISKALYVIKVLSSFSFCWHFKCISTSGYTKERNLKRRASSQLQIIYFF